MVKGIDASLLLIVIFLYFLSLSFIVLFNLLFGNLTFFSGAYSNNVFPDPLSKEEEEKYHSHPFYDAICPILKNRYKILNQEKDLKWYFLGKKNHQETISFLSHFFFFASLHFSYPLQPLLLFVLSSEYVLFPFVLSLKKVMIT